jgi:hypothetical protein
MSNAEVKRKLISRIKDSKDDALLKDLYSLLNNESKAELLLLSEEEIKAIRQAEEEIKDGHYLTDAAVRKKTAQWLGR